MNKTAKMYEVKSMDRRQQKTRKAIFSAFRSLLEEKRYDRITVQDIIDKADVGRSTFYSHFETKDLLLDAICGEIFDHIFENDPCPYIEKGNDLQGKLSHTLWHIKENKSDISSILLSDSSELFMQYFKEHLYKMFKMYIDDFTADVPSDFLLNLLVGSFAETVKWWLKEDTKTPPEKVSDYFMKSIKNQPTV